VDESNTGQSKEVDQQSHHQRRVVGAAGIEVAMDGRHHATDPGWKTVP
jgi:hypothetical protein